MSARLLICLIVCVGESTGSGGAVTQIAPGDDLSLSCPSSTEQDRWEGPQSDNTMRVNLNKTKYLLIKNFKDKNKGRYVCLTEEYNLEMKPAATNDESVLVRASEGDSLFLFCKHLTTTRSTPATHYENMDSLAGPGLFQKHFTLISVCSVFSFLLLVLIGAVYWRKKTKERMESSSVNDNITYAAVNFRQKSETPAVPFPEFSSNSVSKCKNSGHIEEKEVIYSSVKLG
ncbi:hypothetical protein SRHO_G00224370 [Serrasalmus rhombeus]